MIKTIVSIVKSQPVEFTSKICVIFSWYSSLEINKRIRVEICLYYNHMGNWNLLDVADSFILKFPVDYL